jgi:hypothetical protein
MAHRNIYLFKEKCLDCHNFIKPHPFARYFICRFGLIPVQVPTKEKDVMDIICNFYIDYFGKEAKAWKLWQKLLRRRKKHISPSAE